MTKQFYRFHDVIREPAGAYYGTKEKKFKKSFPKTFSFLVGELACGFDFSGNISHDQDNQLNSFQELT